MKINQKQAEVDVKTSERDMLVKKAEAVKQASSEAQEALEAVKSDQKAKVCFLCLAISIALKLCVKIGELENLKDRKQSLQQETKAAKQRVQVSRVHCRRLLRCSPYIGPDHPRKPASCASIFHEATCRGSQIVTSSQHFPEQSLG